MLFLIALVTAALLASGFSSHEDTCYDKFEYVFKVLERISDIEKKMKLQESEMNRPESNRTFELEDKISVLTRMLQDATEKINKLTTQTAADTYIRWGRKACPDGAFLVYDGFAAGSMYTSHGAAANYICLTKDPKWNDQSKNSAWTNFLYGAEYENGIRLFNNLFNHDVPCAVCRVPRNNVIMVPGRNDCKVYGIYTIEYSGYLMSGHAVHAAASEFVCVDDEPEAISQSGADKNGKLFYFVQAKCGSLKCPPYEEGKKITYVVCSFSQ